MTKGTDNGSPRAGSTSTTGATLKKQPSSDVDSPASAAVLSANGAFPKEGLGASTDDADLRSRVFAHVRKYSKASWSRALWEMFHTFAFYCLAFQHPDSWLAFAFVSLCRVRIFILFHDCAHDAFFPSHAANQAVGLILGTFNHTPLSFWQRGHNHHHRHRCVCVVVPAAVVACARNLCVSAIASQCFDWRGVSRWRWHRACERSEVLLSHPCWDRVVNVFMCRCRCANAGWGGWMVRSRRRRQVQLGAGLGRLAFPLAASVLPLPLS